MSKKPQAAMAAAKPSTGKITALTPAGLAELLAMSWPSQGAARMYLNRRGTTVEKLGLMYGMAEGSGVCLQDRTPPGPPPAAKPKKAADPFETWAANVDIQLVAAKEEPVADSVLRDLFAKGVAAKDAVDWIIDDRTAELEHQVDAARRLDLTEQAKATDAKAAKSAARKAKRQAGKAAAEFLAASLPAGAAPAPAIERQPGQVFLQIGDGMERSAADLWAPKLAKQLKTTIHICDAATGKVIASAEAKQPRQAREPGAPRQPSARNGKGDTLSIVIPLLQHETGLSGKEAQVALGWETPPGPWFFHRWAEQAGRVDDLVDMGKVDGARRFRLKAKDEKAAS